MAFNPVPWAVTGSQLDTFVMREFANIATRDAEGIQLPGHAKVTASGTNVSVAAGGVVIRNRQAAGQSYVGSMASPTLVPIPATTASAQSHLICATIRDNDFSPWQPWPVGTPENTVLFGPYFYPERIPATNTMTRFSQLGLTYTSLALARVDMPPNTTNVLPEYITDLRSLVSPRIGFARALQYGPTTADVLGVGETTYRAFPNNASLGVTVPPWATHCIGEITLNQVQVDRTAADFEGRIALGGLFGGSVSFDYNGTDWSPVGYIAGQPMSIFGDMDVRSLQGQTVACFPSVRRTFTANTGLIRMNAQQQVRFDLMFVERTV